MSIIKIAVVGPESTGKSTLSMQLAAHYRTVWVPEYAREYFDKLNRPYKYDDVLAIAEGQLRSEDALAAAANRLIICDTNLIVIQIWLEHKYGRCPEWIGDTIRNRPYAMHLLTDIDMPWIDDPLREHPHLREHLFQRYSETLDSFGIAYRVLSGNQEQRRTNAIAIIDSIIKPATNKKAAL